jgi:hypothetical protein
VSPFATTAATYREQGLAIMPCGPGTKFPGRYTAADGWATAFDWQKYCERLPTSFELDIWERWPDAGVCLALGRASAPNGLQLMAVDIDTENPAEVAAIRAVLPGSPVRKRGAKGETEFYLAPASVPNRPYNNAAKQRMLDLLGHGRQTVLPPTVHPGSGAPYHWTTLDTLENFAVADLPVLPEDIADRLSEALASFGHEPPRLVAGDADPDASASTHRQLNDAALANLGAWVPALNLYKCRQVGGKFKAVAHWRPSSSGRPLSARATNLIISPDGIKDKGAEEGYTPLDLVMAACDADLDTAFRWLQERVAPAAPIVLQAKVRDADVPASVERQARDRPKFPEPDEPGIRRTSPQGNLAGLFLATVDGVAVPEPVTPDAPAEPTEPGIVPVRLCTPPGLIGDVVEWIVASDDAPLPQLALGATIAFLGALMGRRFAHPSKGARTNFYAVGVAPTGYGKGHAPLAIKELARAAGVDGYLGPGRFKSESAIRKALEAKPTQCALMDELGGVMRNILSKRASSHEAGIRDILLELFSSANTTYTGSEGASEKAVPILNPNLCLYGASTPGDLWGNFTSGSAADGFLPRWLVFDWGEGRPEVKDATADVFDPPESLRKALHRLLDTRPGGNLNGTVANKPITATWGAGAQEYFRALRAEKERAIDVARSKGRVSEETILSRFVEHTVKLSLVYAVSIDDTRPVISVAAMEWAREIVEHSTAALVGAIEGRVADTDAQAQYLWVLEEVKRAGADGLLESELMRRVRGRWDSRRHADILSQLAAAGVVWRAMKTPAGGGRPGQRIGAWAEGEREAV